MATTQVIASALAASLNRRGPENYKQIMQSQPLLIEMERTNTFQPWGGGGYNLEFVIKSGKNQTFDWDDYKTPQVLTESDTNQVASLNTKYISGNVTWYKRDEIANQGKERVYNFVEDKKSEAVDSAKEKLGLGLWQDGSGSLPHGIPAVLAIGGMLTAGKTANANYGTFGANTYATIDRSVAANSFFMPRSGPAYTVDYKNGAPVVTYGPYNTAEALVLQGGTDGGIETLFQDCCNNGGGEAPNMAITTKALYNKILAQLRAKVQIQEGGNQRMVDAGFPNHFVYNGCTVVWDQNAPTGLWAFLNTTYFNVRPIAGYDKQFVADETVKLGAVGVDGYTILMTWAGNFQCTVPGRQGALTGKT